MGPGSKGMGLWLIFLLTSGPLFSARASSASTVQFSCDDGCPQQNFPVCGADGEWYQNRCIAYCSSIEVDLDGSACHGSPMPFDDHKPGPQGSESNGFGIRLLAKDVINAFRAEGLRYMGRIKLARELAPRPDASVPVSQPEPDTDGRGNWKVDAVRCTALGDVYKGTMTIPMATSQLNAAEPSPLAPWLRNPAGGLAQAFGSRASDSEALIQESGSYDSSSSAVALDVKQQQQQDRQGILQAGGPHGFVTALKGMWGNMTSLFRPRTSSRTEDMDGDNHLFASNSSSSSSSSSDDEELQEDMELLKELYIGSSSSNDTDLSGGSDRRLLEIIGADNRFMCDRKYPYTALGQIQVVDNTGLYICTGTLIKPDKVLTAAHCVWNTKRNAFYFNLNFAPGRYRQGGNMVNPWGVVPWKSVTVFDAFKKNPSTWDVAVVTLSKKLGSLTGYMGMAAGCSSNTQLTVAGYPQDQAQGTCMANTCRLPYLDCNALTNTHQCDTIMGMSGSPLWDTKNRIRMIHVAGIQGRDENRATTVTQFLINTISKW